MSARRASVSHSSRRRSSSSYSAVERSVTAALPIEVGNTKLVHVRPPIVPELLRENYRPAKVFSSKPDAKRTLLHIAAAEDDPTALVAAIRAAPKSDINGRDATGSPPLLYAVIQCLPDNVRLLLKAGADPNLRRTQDNVGALHLAAMHGCALICAQLVNVRGTDIVARDAFGRTPLHHAMANRSKDTVETLLSAIEAKERNIKKPMSAAHSGVNASDNEGMSPLHFAALYGRQDCLGKLIEAGAKGSQTDGLGRTPLHCVSAHSEYMVRALLTHKTCAQTCTWCDHNGTTPLHNAIADGDVQSAQVLLEYAGSAVASTTDAHGRTPLHWAVIVGNARLAALLMRHAANPLTADKMGQCAAHYAAQHDNVECLEALLTSTAAHDARPDEPDAHGRTAAQWAAGKRCTNALRTLLQHGANANAADQHSMTALHFAAYAGHVECMRLLLANGARVESIDAIKFTPLFRACQSGSSDAVHLLLSHGASVSATSIDHRTALHIAAISGNLPCVTALVNARTTVTHRDARGHTPLACAAFSGNADVVRYLLCQRNVDVNEQNSDGLTPLHWAATRGHRDVVRELLLQPHIHPNLTENDGDKLTPLDYALRSQHVECAKLIRELGGASVLKLRVFACIRIQIWWRRVWRARQLQRARATRKGSGRASLRQPSFTPLVEEDEPRELGPLRAPRRYSDDERPFRHVSDVSISEVHEPMSSAVSDMASAPSPGGLARRRTTRTLSSLSLIKSEAEADPVEVYERKLRTRARAANEGIRRASSLLGGNDLLSAQKRRMSEPGFFIKKAPFGRYRRRSSTQLPPIPASPSQHHHQRQKRLTRRHTMGETSANRERRDREEETLSEMMENLSAVDVDDSASEHAKQSAARAIQRCFRKFLRRKLTRGVFESDSGADSGLFKWSPALVNRVQEDSVRRVYHTSQPQLPALYTPNPPAVSRPAYLRAAPSAAIRSYSVATALYASGMAQVYEPILHDNFRDDQSDF